MNRTKLPIRKRLGDVPQFSRSVDAAVAEAPVRKTKKAVKFDSPQGSGLKPFQKPQSKVTEKHGGKQPQISQFLRPFTTPKRKFVDAISDSG
ncbi:hypothetical protein AgCh_024880 [Apium graveolens]